MLFGEAPGPRGADQSGIPFWVTGPASWSTGPWNVPAGPGPGRGLPGMGRGPVREGRAAPGAPGTALSNAYPSAHPGRGELPGPHDRELRSPGNFARLRGELDAAAEPLPGGAAGDRHGPAIPMDPAAGGRSPGLPAAQPSPPLAPGSAPGRRGPAARGSGWRTCSRRGRTAWRPCCEPPALPVAPGARRLRADGGGPGRRPGAGTPGPGLGPGGRHRGPVPGQRAPAGAPGPPGGGAPRHRRGRRAAPRHPRVLAAACAGAGLVGPALGPPGLPGARRGPGPGLVRAVPGPPGTDRPGRCWRRGRRRRALAGGRARGTRAPALLALVLAALFTLGTRPRCMDTAGLRRGGAGAPRLAAFLLVWPSPLAWGAGPAGPARLAPVLGSRP